MKPLLIMVGADKGGVGKTTVTRVLGDYLKARDFPYRVFDTESPNGILKRFQPDAEIVDLSLVADQMKVFDTLSKNAVTIVDIRAGLLSPTLKNLGDVGLIDMVKTGQISLALFHVLGPSIASLNEIKATAEIIKGATHFLIKNHINDTEFFSWNPELYAQIFGDGRDLAAAKNGIIEVPRLAEMAVEHVEQAGTSFEQFTNSNGSLVLKGLVRTWMRKIFEEFDKANVNGLVGAATTS
jgi:hypothetical protein